jgi:uncharacterized membrane protein
LERVGTYDWLLALHVTGAFLFLGGAVAAAVFNVLARRAERPSEIALLMGLTRYPVLAINVGMLLTIVFGLWLVWHVDGYEFTEGWILASLALWIVAGALGSLGGRRERETRREAQRLAAENDTPSAALRAQLRDRSSNGLSWGAALVGVLILFLMIWKPGA